ncbi:MAG: D-alanyl-D-alanine carboxypeptidase family protein [Bacilli bacterium]
MKKIIIGILCFTFLTTYLSAISSDSIVAIEQDSGRILYAKDENEIKLIASITKIMTAIIACESGKLDNKVTINDSVLQSYGSGIYIEPGEIMTLRNLTYGLMLRSGNDAALAIADYIADDEKEFAKLMNKKAKEIGMTNTLFNNASGLDEETKNTSTSLDMSKLMAYALNNPDFTIITGTKKHVVKTNYKTYVWHNKNRLLNEYKYATGGKTGYTKKALRTLVTSANKNNMNLIITTLNDPNDFTNHKNIYEELFNKYKSYLILDKNNFKVKDDTYYSDLYVINSFYYPLSNDELDSITLNINLEKIKRYKDDQKVGTVDVLFKGDVVHTEKIYATGKKMKKTFWDKFMEIFK